MSSWAILAHGVGSRGALPLPWWQFAWAAVAALVLSFVALSALWKSPRLGPAAGGRAISGSQGPIRVLTWLARIVGLALSALTLAAALFGENVPGDGTNLAPGTIYGILWVGVAIASALLGDIWRAFNPFRTIGLLFPEGDAETAPRHHWWATASLFGFLFLELVHPSGNSPSVLGWALLAYAAIMVGGMFRYGRAWLDAADGFGVLFSMLAGLAPFFVDDTRTMRVRPPLSGLSRVDVRPGTSALILVVLGGTSFDGFSESPLFFDLVGRQTGWSGVPSLLVGLLIMILVASILYWIGARTTARVAGTTQDRAAELFAPSLLPILFGYLVAHYALLLIDQMQNFWFRLSNPFGDKDDAGNNLTDWFGAADGQIDLELVNVDVIAWIQALAIVGGHIAGVMWAHELAVTHFEADNAARSQQSMLIVMVVYSVAGLWLLFAA